MQPRLLFYVQHLLGIGHLVRASRIAASLVTRFDVLLVIGGDVPAGIDLDGVRLLRLPPVRAGAGAFHALVHPDGTPFGEDAKAARCRRLLEAYDAFAPDVLLTEAFPFGRRPMRFELLPLLERARAAVHPPLIACSVRDILQAARPERRAETAALVAAFYDLVLVHGDKHLTALAESFPEADAFAAKIVHTGMVGPMRATDALPGEDHEVIVSAGGGAVGAALLAAALAARPLTRLREARWLLLTGPNGPRLEALPSPGVEIRAFAADLPARLARARVSVSQAGYNTVADLVAAGCRAVLVPFARDGETEQTRRAALFAARRWAITVDEARLSPEVLAKAVDEALTLRPPGTDLALDGAVATAATLADWLSARRRSGRNHPLDEATGSEPSIDSQIGPEARMEARPV